MKEVGKIYSAVDADELEAGDIVDVGDYLEVFDDDSGDRFTLTGIQGRDEVQRFLADDFSWVLAKLLCPKKHAEVYKAWKDGAKVEARGILNRWVIDPAPRWREDVEYRVRQDKDAYKYRAFKDCDELIAEYEKRFYQKARCGVHRLPLIWVRSKDGSRAVITTFCKEYVNIGVIPSFSLEALFQNYTFLDGSPCGVEE